jgi:ribokinase
VTAIAVLGSANMDIVTEVARIPRPGETVLGRSLHYYPGGKGANQAVAAARLGATVAFFGKVGHDAFGDQLVQGLRDDGVDVSAVARAEETPTGTASIWVEKTGENAIACVPGANGAVDPAYVAGVLDRIGAADVLLLQFEIPLATIGFVLDRLPKRRPIVVLDPAPAQDLSQLPLDRIDILTPNRNELRTLTGIDGLEPAARRLVSLGIRGVVCKAGDEGAYWIQETATHVPTLAVDVVDSTAAGDAFNGALGCAVTERPILEAIRFANAAGALATTRHGAQPSLPRRSEVDQLLAAAIKVPQTRG